MKIRAGYDIAFNCSQEVPILLMLSVHPFRQQDLLTDHAIRFSPAVEARDFRDSFGNVGTRLIAPPGLVELSNEFLISDSGLPDETNNQAEQWPVGDLPDEALTYLSGSRYCDIQKLSDQAWAMFGGIGGGWQRVQAICDYVHDRIEFGYHHAQRPDCLRGARRSHRRLPRLRAPSGYSLPFHEHSARYCTGYLGDIGVPAVVDDGHGAVRRLVAGGQRGQTHCSIACG